MKDRVQELLAAAILALLAALLSQALAMSGPAALLLTALAAITPAVWGLRRQSQRDDAHRAFIQRIVDALPEPFYIKDADSHYIVANRAFAARHGLTPEDVIGLTPEQVFVDPVYANMVRQEDRRVLEGLQVAKEEHSPNPITGVERYQLVTKTLSNDSRGIPIIIGINLDVTRWRQTERALNETLDRERSHRERTQAYMQRLIDVMPEPIYIKDSNARFLMVNEAFARERRRSAAELLGLTSFDLAPNPETAHMVAEEDAEILATGKSIFKEYLAHTPDTGEERYRLVHKRFCLDAEGNPIIVGAHFDITDLRRAERTLQNALEREVALRLRVQRYMQRLIDVIPQPVYVKDAESRYIMVNDAFARDRGASREHFVGKLPRELGSSQENHVSVLAEDAQALAGVVISKEEHRPHPVTNEMRYRFISKGTCLDAEGRPVIVGANFDITAWRTAEQAAEQASAAKSQFLASMSHEIRTPLSGVIGTLRLSLMDDSLAPETRNYLETSLSNAESLLTIISDILDFSKIEAGQLKLEHIDFNLFTHVRDCVQIFQAHAASRSLAFRLDFAPGTPEVLRGDPTRIRQVISNLVGNAVKFTETGSVSVLLQSPGINNGRHHIVCEVRDTGIGIPKEALERLFQKFQQADVSTTRRFGGTGLGLAICKQLVEAMGGLIHVESQEGVGTTFRVELWLEPGQKIVEANAPLIPHPRKIRILCAEDVPVNQLIVRTQLAHMGHPVDIVEDGLAAIEALASDDYDLVLMDGRMPRMDGPEAVRAIRAGGLDDIRVRNPRIPIVALTANASEEDKQKTLAAGMDEYLTKPVSERDLHAVIARVIARIESEAPAASAERPD
ncbi:PAS domain-containing protein [Viridibacterium curvum]|uniref:histidine kinase n=1 Tax=Viridibacterium curvum TaxID=1101404 RepID=A0ABP9Q6Q1_9RHOO